MAFGTARTITAPTAGQFGSATTANPPSAGQFGAVATVVWTPASLDAGNLRAWYDAQDLSVLWQDSTLSTPVTSDAEPVGGWVDKPDGNKQLIQATAANRGTTGSSDGLRYVEFDGVSDILRGITASDWKALHGPNGGGIYMVAEWLDTASTVAYIVGNTVTTTGANALIGLRGLIRTTLATDNPRVIVGDGAAGVDVTAAQDSWPPATVKLARFENDTGADLARAETPPGVAGTTSMAALTHSSSDGGTLFLQSTFSVGLRVREMVVRSPVLTSEELTELSTYWNGIYGTPIV